MIPKMKLLHVTKRQAAELSFSEEAASADCRVSRPEEFLLCSLLALTPNT
jgi:hypothetical protein